MSIRAAKLVWLVSLLVIAGCPSEKKDAESDGSSGASGGDSGEGGSGAGGTSGAESGSGGTAGEEPPDLPPEEAAVGKCETADETEGCTGLDQYQECLFTECGYEQCLSGPCAVFVDCLNDAENPCLAAQDGTCEQSQECSDCFSADSNCLIACYEHVDCGDGTAGEGGGAGVGGEAGTGGLPEGTCDDLDACCISLPEEEAASCTAIADAARPDGDFACAVYIDAFCPSGV